MDKPVKYFKIKSLDNNHKRKLVFSSEIFTHLCHCCVLALSMISTDSTERFWIEQILSNVNYLLGDSHED